MIERTKQWANAAYASARSAHPAAWLTVLGAVFFSGLFGFLGVRHHQNFGTWSYDMGIYDQAFWLVSRGGQSFMTVRGLEFWGHHFNPIAILFAPFYWLGAGPGFLYVVQATALGAGAIPVYLIARDRFSRPWVALSFVFSYLMYAPIQWISWANFHPEALVVTPMLFAWWFAMRLQWRAFFICVLIALCTREDTALAVIMLGLVLVIRNRRSSVRYDRWVGAIAAAVGLGWYIVTTKLIIPFFNDWAQPFYIQYFYGNYGASMPEIIANIVKRPDRVISDATKPDRVRFYRDLLTPLGGLPLLGLLPLLILAPQMLASVIGLSPYARQIRWQYTSVMIAPLMIASIEGAWLIWRFQVVRKILPFYLVFSAYVSNVAWSPSPISKNYSVWSGSNGPNPRLATLQAAIQLVPPNASVTATYTMLPQLSQREQVYDWPNPFVPAYWGNDDCKRLPSPTTVEYIVVDRYGVGERDLPMFQAMIAPGGPFKVLLDADNVVVAQRVSTDDAVDVAPQLAACNELAARRSDS